MSIAVMTRVWKLAPAPVKGSRLLLLLALADNANDEGRCWPSMTHLAQKTRLSRRQVIRLLAELYELNEITAQQRTKNGRKTSNMYQLHERYWSDDKMSPHGIDSDKMSPGSDTHVTTPSDKMSPGSDTHVTTLVTPMSHKPSYNRHRTNQLEPSVNVGARTHEHIPEQQRELVTALAATVKTPHWAKTEDDFNDAACVLFGFGASSDDVRGFAEWWKANSYYDDDSAATLTTLMNEWHSYTNGVTRRPTPNGAEAYPTAESGRQALEL